MITFGSWVIGDGDDDGDDGDNNTDTIPSSGRDDMEVCKIS
jgi:hypothetical protein